MKNNIQQKIEDAFNSMLRTDYIPLKDTEKLNRLSNYYVDYFGFLRQIINESDHLIVGRRGTGKTTLLYRGLIECINSWNSSTSSMAKDRTLGIYLDLSKCQSLEDYADKDFNEFEHVFATELYESIKQELNRSWPDLSKQPTLIDKVFSKQETQSKSDTNKALSELARILESGVPRVVNKSGTVKLQTAVGNETAYSDKIGGKAKANPEIAVETAETGKSTSSNTEETQHEVTYRLSIADILRTLGEIREHANISHITLFIDEFSSVSSSLQGRFTSLLRKILGNHSGVFIKLCAITDNYVLGSSIILQRDLFELNLDLDSFVERSGSINSAMTSLEDLTTGLIKDRIAAYCDTPYEEIFEDPGHAVREISIASMGVPRTTGIILKQAFYRSLGEGRKVIRKVDVDYGIKYASKAYLDQFMGACGIAIPLFYKDIFDSILERAISEREKSDVPCSHFLSLPKHEDKLKLLNMFFIIHLLTQGRTTKKEKLSRSLYSFDYGVCIENNLKYGTDKNVLRQQRFAYDGVLETFNSHFTLSQETRYKCPSCETIYNEKDLFIAGNLLTFCPSDKTDLQVLIESEEDSSYTEEEIKIIGAIRSSSEGDEVLARQVADDVGCYVQKVANFGAKLERDNVIKRKLKEDLRRNIYYGD